MGEIGAPAGEKPAGLSAGSHLRQEVSVSWSTRQAIKPGGPGQEQKQLFAKQLARRSRGAAIPSGPSSHSTPSIAIEPHGNEQRRKQRHPTTHRASCPTPALESRHRPGCPERPRALIEADQRRSSAGVALHPARYTIEHPPMAWGAEKPPRLGISSVSTLLRWRTAACQGRRNTGAVSTRASRVTPS